MLCVYVMEQDFVGPSWAQKPFPVPLSYLQDKGFSLLDIPEFQRADSNSC